MSRLDALDRAVAFVCCRQDADGCWRDWRLPPGESRMWTTAYVGYRLASLCGRRRNALVPALSRAASWLRSAAFPAGGWGYSPAAGPDADSTALAIIFLRRAGQALPGGAGEALLRHQQEDGGFSTFTADQSHGAWIASQPDVTAIAAMALAHASCSGTAENQDRALRYLWRHRRIDALWPSYWWTSAFYATEAVSACLAAIGQTLPAAFVEILGARSDDCSVFDAALRLLTLARLGVADSEAARVCSSILERTQSDDGGWPSSAELRLTDRGVYEPWLTTDSGPLFHDDRRLFTTATAIAALATRPGS